MLVDWWVCGGLGLYLSFGAIFIMAFPSIYRWRGGPDSDEVYARIIWKFHPSRTKNHMGSMQYLYGARMG